MVKGDFKVWRGKTKNLILVWDTLCLKYLSDLQVEILNK